MNKLTNLFRKHKDQKEELTKSGFNKSSSFESDTRIENVEPKKGVFITFTNSTFGERQKSGGCTKHKELTERSDTSFSPDMMECTSSESVSAKSDYLRNDWLKFAWACENENVAALIDLIESNESI